MAKFDRGTPEGVRDEAMARFNELAPMKYDAGQEEHGGLLSEGVTFHHLEEEVIDLWFYLQAIKMKLEKEMHALFLARERLRADREAAREELLRIESEQEERKPPRVG